MQHPVLKKKKKWFKKIFCFSLLFNGEKSPDQNIYIDRDRCRYRYVYSKSLGEYLLTTDRGTIISRTEVS